MQRAVVSPSAVPQSHTHSSDARPSKRQKVFGVPSSTATSFSDLQLIQVALAEEEEKKGKSVERLADEIEETDWVLSTVNGDGEHGVKGILVTKAGYSDIDQEAWRPAIVGRRSFRKFNRELEVSHVTVSIFDLSIMISQIISLVYRYPACPKAPRWRR